MAGLGIWEKRTYRTEFLEHNSKDRRAGDKCAGTGQPGQVRRRRQPGQGEDRTFTIRQHEQDDVAEKLLTGKP
jgi:hypothetical protein